MRRRDVPRQHLRREEDEHAQEEERDGREAETFEEEASDRCSYAEGWPELTAARF